MKPLPTDAATTAEAFADSAKAFLADIGGPARVRRLRDARPGFEPAVWRAIAEAGWTSILVPEADGGLGLGLRELLAVAEEIGRRLLPEPFVAAGVHSVALLNALPRSDLRDELLADAMAGRRVIGVAWQEEAGALHAQRCETHLVSAGKAAWPLVVVGSKQWVAPGAGADGWLVLARGVQGVEGVEAADVADTVHAALGPHLCWVESGREVELDALPRVDGSSMAHLHFKRAPAQTLASGEVAITALELANDTARLAQAAELLGVARQAYEMTLAYLKTRIQFGQPIGANQALQHRMVDAYIEIEIAAACLRDVLDRHQRNALNPDQRGAQNPDQRSALNPDQRGAQPLAALASRAKARCTEVALRLTRLAIQLHGAIGFTDEFDLGLYWKRAVHLAAWLGARKPTARAFCGCRLRARARSLRRRHTRPLSAPCCPPDTDWAALPEATLRQSVRAFLHAHYPAPLRHAPRRVHWHAIKDWYFALSRQGWIAPAWPKAHGGMALPPALLLAFIEEFEDFGAARLPDQGLINLGPVLIQHGTPQQQREWLPPILRGEHVWCQGYSEPNAGSDLASLRTEAVIDGEHFVVNGQKIWTTLAQDATHIFLLVRTDKTVKKQAGISFLLAALNTPGITVRPIRNIAGDEEFCEVFLDDVRVPRANLVGQLNEGWAIAKALLGFERLFVGSPKTCHHAIGLLRIFATETYTRIAAKIVDVAAEDGGTRREVDFGAQTLGAYSVEPLAPLFTATITTIYGGSNEIQRNILARQVLDLPA